MYKITCRSCKNTWTGEKVSACKCGSTRVIVTKQEVKTNVDIIEEKGRNHTY